MIQQHSARIYKSNLRGVLEYESYRCLSVFNFGNYQEIARNPFGSLQVLNEEILAPQQRISMPIEANTQLLILPLFGGVEYKDSIGNESFIGVEQIQIITTAEASSFELFNSYKEETVHYLQLRFKTENSILAPHFQQFDFGLTNKNQLIPLFEIPKSLGFIGIYEGRKEGFYTLKNNSNGVFIFVIHGAFEVENRLLESKDGLSLHKKEVIEWEALSENALLLVFEIAMNQL
jgi:redox-sensitive bicupin YhaK (pirin superfamily)